jgi:hypothetical protein
LDVLYRARAFQSERKLLEALCYPDKGLGPPPATQARAGRMNANGISVFYGANAPKAAIAEVRPPVGSWVVTARFEIIRPLRLLDLSALNAVTQHGSIFDRGFTRRLEFAVFLRTLSQRMTRPIMPNDEAFDYLATQAIADFLATENDPPLDGIIFPSVQAADGALNFGLFHKSASVEPVELPAGTNVEPRSGDFTDEGWETEYVVTEEMTPPEKVPSKTSEFQSEHETRGSRFSAPEPTLRIDLQSVTVHLVRGVALALRNTACVAGDEKRPASTMPLSRTGTRRRGRRHGLLDQQSALSVSLSQRG